MLTIAFAGNVAASVEPAVRRHLTIPCNIVGPDEAGIVSCLAETDVLITAAFTTEMGCAARRLQLVQVPGAGIDRIDRAALPPNTQLANVYGHETGIAEYVIGAMISLTREFARVDAALRQGDWQSLWAVGRAPPPTWHELAGRTLGILGYGRIGREVARRGKAFGMQVRAIRRDNGSSRGDEFAQVNGTDMTEEVLRTADYVVVAMPATPETIGAIGRGQLRLMKPTAFLINVARAEIVDEQALYEAIEGRAIAGAALDVWYRYPTEPVPARPARFPFHELPNVLMTPHVAGWTDGTIDSRGRLIAENIRRIARGEPPLNLITGG
jgi:phosphoglycerate dehydrogenase-like enzyme